MAYYDLKDGGMTWTENQIHPNYYGYSPEVMALAVVSNSRIVGYERAMNLPIYTNDFENWYYNQGKLRWIFSFDDLYRGSWVYDHF